MAFQKWITRLGTEIIPLEVNYFQTKATDVTQEHTHPGQLHIACFEKGAGWCCVNGVRHRIRPGDIYLILPGEMHQFFTDPENPYRACFLHFSWFGVLPTEIPLTLKVPRQQRQKFFQLCSKLAEMFHAGLAEGMQEFFFYSDLLYFWGLLLQFSGKDAGENLSVRPREGINKQLNKIIEKLHGPPFFYPGIDTLAEESGISRRQLTKLFRKSVGCGIKQYYLSNVMHYAKRMREQKSVTIAELARLCGYSTAQNFLLAYKKFFASHDGKKSGVVVVWTPVGGATGKTMTKPHN